MPISKLDAAGFEGLGFKGLGSKGLGLKGSGFKGLRLKVFWSLRVGEQAYHVCLVAFSLHTISDEAMWSVRAGSCPADGAAKMCFLFIAGA